MTNTMSTAPRRQTLLRRTAQAWFGVAAVGQLAFVGFILLYFATRSLTGNWATWDDKPLIEGYTAGDPVGNVMFMLHVLLAAVVTAGGLVQLVPWLRRRWPALHRWNGRVFVAVGAFLALGGLWLTWVRGTRLSDNVLLGLPITVNGLLILWFCWQAYHHARARRFDVHRRFALRAFLAVNGVWFLRIGMMAWIVLNQGMRGMNATMSGPADIGIALAAYFLPLAILQLYFRAERTGSRADALLAAGAIGAGVLVTAVGVFGTVAFMWGPYV